MIDFESKYTGAEVEALLDAANGKQDKIEDLNTIRAGAALGATALQSVPEGYVTEDELIWTKTEGEAGVRLKGTNGTATGNLAISAGDDKTASDGTPFASVASGDHAVAFGYGNTCAGRTTLAQGLYNIVNGKDAVAFGQRNLVNGDQAFAAGQQNEVSARIAVAIGYKNKATNTDSIAIGYQNTSSGSASVAMGDTCEAIGTSSTAMGYKTKATGAYTSTFGQNTQATNAGEVAMGLYNKSTTSTDASEQTLFSFGIGTSDTNRVNAFEIKKNGDVYIGDKLLSGGGITTETDPIFSASPAASITEEKKAEWDNKMDKVTLAAVATSGNYNDLSNKPTIPAAVTESTVSGWGFTKNTGTYSKPSTGIPKTDLASAVQASLDKADTALQSYTEQYKGTVTGVKINGTTKDPSSGVVDLGTVITSHQDISGKQDKLVSGTNIKTVNGTSLLGSGNIAISGGSGAYPEVNHGTSDTTFALTPNTFHIWDEVSALTLTLGSETSGVANEFVFQFTSGVTATTLTLPDDIKWANNSILVAPSKIYQVSILNGLACVLEFDNEVSISPISLSIGANGDAGITLYNYYVNKLGNNAMYRENPENGQIIVDGQQCTEIIIKSFEITYEKRITLLTAQHSSEGMDCYYLKHDGSVSLYTD